MGLLEILEFNLRRWKRLDSHQSRKRLLLTILLVCILLIYVGPFFYRTFWRRKQPLRELCRDPILYEIEKEEQIFEAHKWNQMHPDLNRFLPYVGNGRLGFAIDKYTEQALYIKGKRGLDTLLPFYPLVDISLANAFKPSSTAVRYVHGTVNRITCYSYYYKPVTVRERIYAHRLISSLLVQEIDIDNPTDVPFTFKLSRIGWKGQKALKDEKLPFLSAENTDFYQIQDELSSKDDITKSTSFSIIYPDFRKSFEVPKESKKKLIFRTFVNYTRLMPKSQMSRFIPDLKLSLREVSKKISHISPIALYDYHDKAWSDLWNSGFGISFSKAYGSLNGDSINATMYYILSQKSVYQDDRPRLDLQTALRESNKSDLINKPDSCYHASSTLHADSLWSNLASIKDINNIVNLWLLTLEKNGCHNLVESGAAGTMQAFILSLAALKFTKHHLEFNTHPKELHRNYFIKRLRYSQKTLLNITVTLGEDNKASISVSLDKNEGSEKFYACDGGCMDDPVQLSLIPSQFPVKLTEPLTAILYITSNYQHIKELRHTIHVKEIAEAPAHEHNIIALHRHGHQLGGLPAIFWLSIVFLIVIFHLFLAKLIYNEYCVSSQPSYHRHGYERVRYAV